MIFTGHKTYIDITISITWILHFLYLDPMLKPFVVTLGLCVLGMCLILDLYGADVKITLAPSLRAVDATGQELQRPNFIHPVEGEWELNRTALSELSRLKPLETAQNFVLSQDSLATKRRLPLMFGKKPYYVKDKDKDSTPEISPFINRTLGVCSLVGNSGILTGSKCGQKIDSGDFVIRFNMPPVCSPYLDDIGRRTDLVTTSRGRMNSKWGLLKSRTGQEKFLHHLHDQYGEDTFVVSAPFTIRRDIEVLLSISELLQSSNSSVVPLYISPIHVRQTLQAWRDLGLNLKGRINFSSGFYYTSVALELCDQVNIYGFWPFRTDREGRPVRYHYYKSVDNGGLSNSWHAMDKEFEKLLQLHNLGVLQLINGNCR
ncbi:ST8SIA6 [Branchiostoma lanceolatum]|uniref:ST8SIA6 protein n=1 Tax=Branchiostoma lanceolatum TaxID=7740 RepID=A0A8K0EXH0_BRALA|nr:ST8SIA6 [Branchiostoma lanceolatum]